jgi:hypothetical protein
MATLEWMTHQDREICLIHLDQTSEEEARAFFETFARELSGKEAGEVYLLADLKGATFLPRVALDWQAQQSLMHSKCERLAVVGATGAMAAAASTFLSLARAAGLEFGRKVRFFQNHDLAKEWLVERSASGQQEVEALEDRFR